MQINQLMVGNEVLEALCKVLKLDPGKTVDIQIHTKLDCIVTAQVERVLTRDEFIAVADLLKAPRG